MSARQHSRFVHFILPWLIAAAGGALYLVTLHSWVSFDSLELVAKVTGWDWNTMRLGPVTLLLTWPVRWLPPQWQTPGLNVMSAVLAALSLGLLAKCVALLPHDRTRDQRQRERSDFSFLTLPLAWLPPVAAATLLAFQLTFWENATAMTGAMVNLALFAICVYCFLRFRVLQQDGYLATLAFTFSAAAANGWGIIAFGPLFLIAILWAKGISFFDGRFLVRTTAAGLAGLLFYLVQPLALISTGQTDDTLLELLRTSLGIQRQILIAFPRYALLFCSVASVLPIFFIGIRWPSTFSDMSAAGSAITNFLFRLIHSAFLVFCTWAMFDPPFSPRERGFGLPFLHFYFLTALAIGYLLGYVMLVFGQEPERKLKRPSEGMLAMCRFVSGLAVVGTLAAGAGLAVYNFPAIRGHNGPLVSEFASTLVPPPNPNAVLLSDDPTLLPLAIGRIREEKREVEPIPIYTDMLPRHVYQRHHELKYGARWPALRIEDLSDPLGHPTLLRQILVLGRTNHLYYLHASFGYYFESFYQQPTNTIFVLQPQSTNSTALPPLPDEEFERTHQLWEALRARLVDNPVIARMQSQRVRDAAPIGSEYARAFNTWGVLLQRRHRLEDAGRFFAAAVELNKNNFAAVINLRYNENLRAGNPQPVLAEKELNDQLGLYRDLNMFLRLCGPVDEPGFCFKLGRIFSDGSLHRQAAQQYARALELQPNQVDTQLWLASATLNAQLYDDTLRIIREIREAHPNLSTAHITDLIGLESWARFYQGDLESAEKILIESQEKYPESIEPLQTLNDIYLAANRTNSAMSAIEKLIARMPGNPRPVITKSALQIHTGAYEEAVKTLSTVLEAHPEFYPALVNRALAYSRLNRLEEAQKDYLRLLEIAPELNIVHFHLGEIDYQRANAVPAQRHYRKFLEKALPGSPEARTAQHRLDDIAAGKLGG